MNASMNNTDTTEGGYANSKMATETLPNLVDSNGVIGKTFESHILEYRNLLSNRVNIEVINQSGGILIGAANNWEWYTRSIDLMSEANVYGTTVVSSSFFDTALDNMQYALFQLKPELKHSYENIRFNYWLKNISSKMNFAAVFLDGPAGDKKVTSNYGVRPRFLIG